ncbi:MAG TPA: DUF2779 domain-containing protein [Noviherbaspirillum sp.]|nr:DUF2779 domain-containing protein [Noviherbaspirillum sp.]
MKPLSKSRLLEYVQCPKRLWLQLHAPALREDSTGTTASFAVGNQIGEMARRLYDPKGKGTLISFRDDGFEAAFARTKALLSSTSPIFEAGFSAVGALAFADVMLPVRRSGTRAWRMVEVKSSASVKDYYRTDAAIQAYVAREAGVPLASISIAHIDSKWVYPGNDDYNGLLVEQDVTQEAFERADEIAELVAAAHVIARRRKEPQIQTGGQCTAPYECGFAAYCASQEPQVEYPVHWIPQVRSKALRAAVSQAADMRDIPDALLNASQLRVKQCTLQGKTFFDGALARQMLASHRLPAYFLDFETIQFAVPIWKGTSPFQNIPFQFSVHRLSRTGKLERDGFLDLSGQDPSRQFADALIRACGERGPVFVYNAGFEKGRMKELAARFPRLRRALLAIVERVVDLQPVAEACYYHPSQQGSWSIKKVLPAMAPDLSYSTLDGVRDGGMAMDAYLEAIRETTSAARKAELRAQLEDYCALDTLAMVRLWQVFTGRDDIQR